MGDPASSGARMGNRFEPSGFHVTIPRRAVSELGDELLTTVLIESEFVDRHDYIPAE
jgi:hypothetical protein